MNPTGIPGPVQGQHAPGQGADWAGGQQGSYDGYPQAGGDGYGNARPAAYLEGAPVGFGEAARGAFGNVFTYRGRASRSAFWWFALLEAIVYAIMGVLSDRSWVAGVILDIVVGIPMVLTGLSLAVRRLHDSSRSGWWWWIGFVPLVGWIILLVCYLLPGTPGPNRYNLAPTNRR